MYRIATLPMVIGLSLGLAACGSDGADTATGSDPTSGPQTATPVDGSQPVLGGGGAIGTITITITHPDADEVSYTIGCLGDAFPVTPEVAGVSGEEACRRLADAAVLDRLVNGPPANEVCTEIYGGPDVAVVAGEINGEAVDATFDRSGGCGIDDWDTLMAGVLPPARGVSD